jgi:Catalase
MREPSSNQLQSYAEAAAGSNSSNNIKANKALLLTTSNGAPVDSLTASMTAGKQGPIVLQDFALLDHLSLFDRERIPERVVMPKVLGPLVTFK